MEVFLNHDISTLSRAMHAMLNYVHTRYRACLQCPFQYSEEQHDRFAASTAPLMPDGVNVNIIGILDGKFVATRRPNANQRVMYNGYHRLHGFGYQGVQFPDGMLFVLGPKPVREAFGFVRASVEHGFGGLVRMFERTTERLRPTVEVPAVVFEVSVIFMNLQNILTANQTSQRFNLRPHVTLDEYLHLAHDHPRPPFYK